MKRSRIRSALKGMGINMPTFKKVETQKEEQKGDVYIKIVLQGKNLTPGYPAPGSRREVIVVKDSTVGEVFDAINLVLFGAHEEEPE